MRKPESTKKMVTPMEPAVSRKLRGWIAWHIMVSVTATPRMPSREGIKACSNELIGAHALDGSSGRSSSRRTWWQASSSCSLSSSNVASPEESPYGSREGRRMAGERVTGVLPPSLFAFVWLTLWNARLCPRAQPRNGGGKSSLENVSLCALASAFPRVAASPRRMQAPPPHCPLADIALPACTSGSYVGQSTKKRAPSQSRIERLLCRL